MLRLPLLLRSDQCSPNNSLPKSSSKKLFIPTDSRKADGDLLKELDQAIDYDRCTDNPLDFIESALGSMIRKNNSLY